MEFCSTYIDTDKFDEVVEFYEKLFQKKGTIYTENRWVEFDLGNKLSIYNRLYDKALFNSGDTKKYFDQNYINDFSRSKEERHNNAVILNFYTPDLKKEFDRIKKLRIDQMSEIMFVNISAPYYFFNVYDPDSNTIEIFSDSM